MDLMALKQRLVEAIDPAEFWVEMVSGWKQGTKVKCFNPDHQDPNPSLSLDKTGKFKCHGCGIKGSSIVQAYEYAHQVDFTTALRELAQEYLKDIYVPQKKITLWHERLLDDPEKLLFLKETRGIGLAHIKEYELGWNGTQYTIPILDEAQMPVNVRKYRPGAKRAKVVSYKKGFGTARLFPLIALEQSLVYLCEGETDTLCARAHGINGITSTGGASHWKEEWTPLFMNKDVVVVPDTDKPGMKWGAMVGQSLMATASSVKVLHLPTQGKEKDLSDVLMRTSAKDFLELVNDTDYLLVNRTDGRALGETPIQVSLNDASLAEHYYTLTEMDCMISGKELSPYLAPKKVKVDCAGGRDICEMCHRKPKGFTDILEFNLSSEQVLELVDVSKSSFEIFVRRAGNIPSPKCGIVIHHEEKANVEKVTLSPSLDDPEGSNVSGVGYFLGHGIDTNRTYRARGFLLPEPARQRAVHIITEATSVYDALDSFKPTEEELEDLRGVGDIGDLFEWYEKELSQVTQIVGRPDLHAAIDLVYHSPLSFNFNNEFIRKGWLETLVYGDTQQGKTNVAHKLSEFYRLGEIATGEASTFAGLVGGLHKVNDRWMVNWGMVARHDRRLVFIDETSGLSIQDIERMSRVRSEGKAELVKVVTQVTNARCRLIWLANPRSGNMMNTYASGVDVLRELIGKSEDISRFDYVLTVANSEVDPAVMNKPRRKTMKISYPQEVHRNLVLWCWSRKPEQIEFTKAATKAILSKYALELSKDYSPQLPLVQKENIRVKIARVAAAIAGRRFSTPDGEKLVVELSHVKEAVAFLKHTYDKSSLGYDVYSRQMRRANTLKDPDEVEEQILASSHWEEIVEGLLENSEVNVSDFSDFTGTEKWEAKEMIGMLVRNRALTKRHGNYMKRPAFISLLNRLRAQIRI